MSESQPKAGSGSSNKNGVQRSRSDRTTSNVNPGNSKEPDPQGGATVEQKNRRRSSTVAGFEARSTSTVICGMTACKNVRIFTACMSVILLLEGASVDYTSAVMAHLGRRYRIAEHEQDFAMGVKIIGFVVTLIFVGLLGNRFHKPLAILAGCVTSAFGLLFMLLPYLVHGASSAPSEVSDFAKAGLCGSSSQTLQTMDGQCTLLLPKGGAKNTAFSLVCFGQFLCGVGAAFYSTLGVVYIADNAPNKAEATLCIGIILSIFGLGQSLGSILATSFLSWHENFVDYAVIMFEDDQVGCWWFGYIIFTIMFLLVAAVLLKFPPWFVEPEWIRNQRVKSAQKYRERQMKRAERKRKEKRKLKEKLKKRKEQKERAKNEERKNRGHGTETETDGETGDETRVKNDIHTRDKDNNSTRDTNGIEAARVSKTSPVSNGSTSSKSKTSTTKNTSKNGGNRETGQTSKTRANSTYKSTNGSRGNKKHVTLQHKKVKRGGRFSVRKERIRDLPRYLWKLVHNRLLLSLMAASVCGAYVMAGYVPNVSRFVQVHYQRSASTSFLIQGLCGRLSWAVGVLLGTIMIRKFQLKQKGSLMICIFVAMITMVIFLLQFAFSCKTGDVMYELSNCNGRCGCYDIQYQPVCGSDDVTFLSPCYAGCENVQYDVTTSKVNLTGCSCTDSREATIGPCSSECASLIGYSIFLFIAALLTGIPVVPIVLAILNVVKERGRSLTLSFAVWIVTVFAFVPGPVIFRAMGNSACLSWQQDCFRADKCWHYDMNHYRYAFNGFACVTLVISGLSLIPAYIITKAVKCDEEITQDSSENEEADDNADEHLERNIDEEEAGDQAEEHSERNINEEEERNLAFETKADDCDDIVITKMTNGATNNTDVSTEL